MDHYGTTRVVRYRVDHFNFFLDESTSLLGYLRDESTSLPRRPRANDSTSLPQRCSPSRANSADMTFCTAYVGL